MASTYSSLKIELIATGEQSGVWGDTTNTNLGTALGEAITGSADVAFSSAADVTVTLTDTNAAQTARNLRLNITESGAGIGYVGNLVLGSGCQIEKLYLINNTTTGAKTVKNTTGTGIAVPAGKSMFVYNNGTDVVDATTYLSSLTLGTALPVASGGTGATSSSGAPFALKGANSDITSITGLTTPLATTQGGTGGATAQAGMNSLAGATTSGSYLRGNGTNVVMSTIQAADVPTLNQNTTGTAAGLSSTLAVTSGGTGITTTTAYGVLAGGTTSTGALQNVGTGTAGQVLTSNGPAALATWQTSGGGQFKTQLFTGPGTWTNPGSVTSVRVTVVGGGGGGQPRNPPGARGGYGGYGKMTVTIPTSPVSVTVGSGGGGASPGGTSSFGPYASATGGGGGSYPPAAVGGNGSASTSGTFLTGPTEISQFSSDGILFGSSTGGPGGAYSTTAGRFAGAAGPGINAQGVSGTGGAVIVEFVG